MTAASGVVTFRQWSFHSASTNEASVSLPSGPDLLRDPVEFAAVSLLSCWEFIVALLECFRK